MAGAALGAAPACFARQAQHLEKLRLVLRGRRSTWTSSSTWDSFGLLCVASAALGAPQARFAWQVQQLEHLHRGPRKQHSTWSTSAAFCVAGAALGAAPARFAWQAQHLEHLRLVLCGMCSTWSTFIEVHGSPATIDYFGPRIVLRGRRSTWSASASFCVAGPRKPSDIGLLWAPPRFAWQAQHLQQLRLVLRGRRSPWSTFIDVHGSPATIDYFGRRIVLRGRRSTCSSSGSFCVAGAALGAAPAPWQAQHLEHLHRGPRKSGDN